MVMGSIFGFAVIWYFDFGMLFDNYHQFEIVYQIMSFNSDFYRYLKGGNFSSASFIKLE